MARQGTHSQWVSSDGWVIPAGLGLVIWLGDLSQEACGWIASSAVRVASETLCSLILQVWQATQAPACGHGILHGLVLQILGSSWPLILKFAASA